MDHRSRQSGAIAEAALSLILDRGASALTMAAIATTAGISRQTLYRYYPDIDAVLVGVAELVASHDDHLEAEVRALPEPAAQLDTIVRAVATAAGHDNPEATALLATLPPKAREVLAQHEARTTGIVVDILQTGIDRGIFRAGIEPSADAPLILGLASAGDPADPGRAITLVHRIVDPQENPS
ncbi:MAG: TetR/AcrR family transcriptional regulator [Microthrixaceae bacterium]